MNAFHAVGLACLVALLPSVANAQAFPNVPPPGSQPVPEPEATPTDSPQARVPDHAGYSYNYAIYDSRYSDLIVSLDAWKPLGKPKPFRPFVGASVVRDSRTEPGSSVPLILSDNYAVGGVGVQWTNADGLRAFAQAGGSVQVGPVAAQPSGGDVRGGVQFYRDFGPTNAAHHGYGNFYGSTTYYSRYSDWILYAQAEAVSNLGNSTRPFEAFARQVLNLDTHYYYYSNLTETSAGLRYRPFGVAGPIISVEEAYGAYLRGAVRPVGTPAFYWDFRPTISYGFSL